MQHYVGERLVENHQPSQANSIHAHQKCVDWYTVFIQLFLRNQFNPMETHMAVILNFELWAMIVFPVIASFIISLHYLETI